MTKLEQYKNCYKMINDLENAAYCYAEALLAEKYPDTRFSFDFRFTENHVIAVIVGEVMGESIESFYELDSIQIPVERLLK